LALERLCGDEEGAIALHDVFGVGIAGGNGHGCTQGLKPQTILGRYRHG
jgi:hypothetical protein